MNITQKDVKELWRSPVLWLVLALVSFILAWMVWQMIDQYNSLQTSLATLPNPPTITDALWVPFVLTFAKLLMLVIAMTAGFSLARERSQKTIWYLLINRKSHHAVVVGKYLAQLRMLFFAWLHLVIVMWLLASGGQVNWSQVMLGSIGLTLFLCWLIALGQLISSYSQSTGSAVLLNVVMFVLLWMLGGEAVNQGYGLNWLLLMSPAHHLRWFCEGQIALSSMIYFIAGTGVFLWLTESKLSRLKQTL